MAVASTLFAQVEITLGDDDVKMLAKMAMIFQQWSQQPAEQKAEETIEKKNTEITDRKLEEPMPGTSSSPAAEIIPKACKYSTNKDDESTIYQTRTEIIVNYIYSVFNFQSYPHKMRQRRSTRRKVSTFFFNINRFVLHLFERS